MGRTSLFANICTVYKQSSSIFYYLNTIFFHILAYSLHKQWGEHPTGEIISHPAPQGLALPWSAYNPREMLVRPADANHILLTHGQGVLGSGHLQTSAFPSDGWVCVCCRVREHVPLPWAVGWMFPVHIRSFGRIGSAQGNYTRGLGFLGS